MLKKIPYPLLIFAILFYSLLPGIPMPEVVLCIGSDGNAAFFRLIPNISPTSEIPPSKLGTTQIAHDDCLDISVHTPGPRIAPISKRYADLENRSFPLLHSEHPDIPKVTVTFQYYQISLYTCSIAPVAVNPVLLI